MRAASFSGRPEYWPGSAPGPCPISYASSWWIHRHAPVKSIGERSCALIGMEPRARRKMKSAKIRVRPTRFISTQLYAPVSMEGKLVDFPHQHGQSNWQNHDALSLGPICRALLTLSLRLSGRDGLESPCTALLVQTSSTLV